MWGRIAKELWRSIWRYRLRVLAALALVVIGKVAAVSVPLLQQIVDAFSGAARIQWLSVFLLLGYAAVRFSANLFNELRDVVFSLATHRTVADFMQRTLAHLHHLGARFHSKRETGGVIRNLEKSTGGIGFLLGVAVSSNNKVVDSLLNYDTIKYFAREDFETSRLGVC